MRVAGWQHRLPNIKSLARAIHRPPHVASLLITQADVVQGRGNIRMPRGENPPTKLQRALLHRKRIFMSTKVTVCVCEVFHGVTDVRMVGRQNPSSKLQRALLHRKRIFMSTEGTV